MQIRSKHTARIMSSTTATPSTAFGKASDRGSSVKPSPASTYGESVASDVGDGPQTPAGDMDGMYLRISCFRALLLIVFIVVTFVHWHFYTF
jgi:hypothetical protein